MNKNNIINGTFLKIAHNLCILSVLYNCHSDTSGWNGKRKIGYPIIVFLSTKFIIKKEANNLLISLLSSVSSLRSKKKLKFAGLDDTHCAHHFFQKITFYEVTTR